MRPRRRRTEVHVTAVITRARAFSFFSILPRSAANTPTTPPLPEVQKPLMAGLPADLPPILPT
eukprot:4618365-Pleurochrysis_carterae.AAC.1